MKYIKNTMANGPLFILSLLMVWGMGAVALAQSKNISIVSLDFPPITNQNKAGYGFIGELFNAIFEPHGYQVNINIHPWARAYELSKRGKVADGIFPSIHTEERENWFVFSDPIITSGYVLITRQDTGIRTYGSLSEFKGITIGVLRKGVTGSELDSSDFKKEEGQSFEINIRKLLRNRFDIITGEYLAINNIINRKFSDQKDRLVFIDPPISKVRFHLMISKRSPDAKDILKVCNQGNIEVRQNGTLDRLKRKYGIKEFD